LKAFAGVFYVADPGARVVHVPFCSVQDAVEEHAFHGWDGLHVANEKVSGW
jgi:hypothetical protein